MNGADWVGWGSALAAVAAFWQLPLLRRDNLDARAAEIRGVCVDTVVRVRLNAADAPNGMSRWACDFTVQNPGHLPVSSVDVRVIFPCPGLRLHFDGSTDPAGSSLEIHTPVVAAGGTRKWERTVLIPFDRTQNCGRQVRRVLCHAGCRPGPNFLAGGSDRGEARPPQTRR